MKTQFQHLTMTQSNELIKINYRYSNDFSMEHLVPVEQKRL